MSRKPRFEVWILPIHVRLSGFRAHSLYVHAIDRGDLDLLRSLYADDAQEQHGKFCGSVDDYSAWLEPVLGYFDTADNRAGNANCAKLHIRSDFGS